MYLVSRQLIVFFFVIQFLEVRIIKLPDSRIKQYEMCLTMQPKITQTSTVLSSTSTVEVLVLLAD